MIRFVTKGTIEEDIYALGETKLALDNRVAGVSEGGDGAKAEDQGKEIIRVSMMSKIKKEMEMEDGDGKCSV